MKNMLLNERVSGLAWGPFGSWRVLFLVAIAGFVGCGGGGTPVPWDPGREEMADAEAETVQDDKPDFLEDITFDVEAEVGPIPCESAAACPEGLGCIGGTCGPCETNTHCAGRGVCRENRCLPCRSAFECDEGLGCLPDGTCGECEDGKDCGGRLCEEGACVPCVPGEDDDRCREQFGEFYRDQYGPGSLDGLICRPEGICSNTCISGLDCFWVEMVCGEGGYCVGCSDDSFCLSKTSGGYPEGTQCLGGRCIQGACLSHKSCNEAAPVCDKTCRPCVTNEECTAVVKQLGKGNEGICTEAQSCVAGNCGGLFKVACGNGLVCDSYRCRDCLSDEECETAYQNPNQICELVEIGGAVVGRCKVGKEPGTACYHEVTGVAGVVGQDNRCHSCDEFEGPLSAQDGKCKNAYGPLYICDGEQCVPGCVPGQRCPDGRLCREDNRCTSCQDVYEDSACGTGYLCIKGLCVEGICRNDDFCMLNYNGKVCVDHYCRPCGQDARCPSGNVCVAGKCTAGNCCTDANCWPIIDCGGTVSCTNYHCQGCIVGSDCYPQWPCLDKSGACKPDNTCKEPGELNVLEGFCFIKNECITIGTNFFDLQKNLCHVCYWEEDQTGQVVAGSKTKWTPGTWNPVEKRWIQDWCFIDGRCIKAGSVKENVSGYGQSQSAACWHCDPRKDDWQSLHDWSVRPDTNKDPDPHVNWTARITCDDPLFSVPAAGIPWSTVESRTPAYSGTLSGYCWKGECRGIAWTPWLPLGPAGAGVVYPASETDPPLFLHGKEVRLVGSFGGGFGAGFPKANPGCYMNSSCQ